MDKIIIKGLEFEACHGVLAEEKTKPQKFVIDLELYKNLALAGQTDDLADTINYAEVYAEVKSITENHSFNLIEKLADEIARRILAKHPLVAIKVKVYKPNAPVEGKFDYFAVEIYRKAN